MILEKVLAAARLLSRIGQSRLSARAVHREASREIREKYYDRVLE